MSMIMKKKKKESTILVHFIISIQKLGNRSENGVPRTHEWETKQN